MRKLFTCLGLALSMTWSALSYGGEIDFREDFALAADRATALKQLVPGTEDYYYYHALHYLHTEQYEQVQKTLDAWPNPAPNQESERKIRIRTRLAFAMYDKDPENSLKFIRDKLNLHYPHQRELLDQNPNLPTELNNAAITRESFLKRSLPNGSTTDGLAPSALDWYITQVDDNRLRHFLSRLNRPDYPNLVPLVHKDISHPTVGIAFGTHPIHRQLMVSQLEELLKLQPRYINQHGFVTTYLTKLQPGPDENWRQDRKLLQQYLDRLEAFADRTDQVHNTLKANVLFHQLQLARLNGKYDKERFLKYLKLPRFIHYVTYNVQHIRQNERHPYPCDLNSSYDGSLLTGPIGNEEPLVREYLLNLLRDANDTKEFEPYIDSRYLSDLFAETKILNGLGDETKWTALLNPGQFKALKERIDLDFVPTNPTRYSTYDSVTLEVDIKNVSTLIVKVFEINTQNFYRTNQREVDTDINLDGLVANVEQIHKYTDSPLRRIRRKFEFPQLSKPGLYVIDFIGNGRSSRALVRKGDLKHLVRTSSAGHVFTILDEQNQPLKNAKLWLNGQEYLAEKDGLITVPFSNQPKSQKIVITASLPTTTDAKVTTKTEIATLTSFQHEGESYNLATGFYVDRQTLLQRQKAKLLIRPSLQLNAEPISLKLLEDVKLLIVATDLDGIVTTQEVGDLKLFEDRETVHEFSVPARLTKLDFRLSARIQQLSKGGQKLDLASQSSVQLNEIDRTQHTEDLYLVRAAGQFAVELRGKTGEALVSRPVNLAVKHHDFVNNYNVTLKTDNRGRIALGALADIQSIEARSPQGIARSWLIHDDRHSYPDSLHGTENQTLDVNYLPRRNGEQNTPGAPEVVLDRSQVSLLELRGGTYYADRYDHLKVVNGQLQIEKLPAGDYDLLLKKSGKQINIRITAGKQQADYLVGSARSLEVRPQSPLQIEAVQFNVEKPAADTKENAPLAGKLMIQVRNANTTTRVHVLAGRILPEYDSFARLSAVGDRGKYVFTRSTPESNYLTGRNIGDEYRYIIDRKYATKFPGNTLDRPSLLLNPWAVRETETGEQLAADGGVFGATGADAQLKRQAGGVDRGGVAQQPTANFSNIDFLAMQSAILTNLVPDKNGLIEVDIALFKGQQDLRIVAIDALQTTQRHYSLPDQGVLLNDLRLVNALNPQQHFAQQKQVSVTPVGETFTLHDITTSKFEVYDNLGRVYSLFATLNNDPKLNEFSFVLNWPKLKDEEKKTLYSKHASHELSFFLFKKDPEFYKTVIVPYLKNKKDKTFMDHFLLENKLDQYLESWRYNQLNTVERILLSQRIAGEGKHTSRYISDQFQLLPPNIDEYLRLFNTGVQRGGLEAADDFGVNRAKSERLSLNLIRSENGKDNANGSMPTLGGFAGGASGPVPAPSIAAPATPAAEPAMAAKPTAEQSAGRKQMDKLMQAEKKAKEMAPRSKASSARELEELAKAGDANRDDMIQLSDEARFYDAKGDDLRRRGAIRQLYRKLNKTMEWAENNYHHLTIDVQKADLINVNAFWRDYAAHDPAKPFVSKHLAAASRNFPEIMLALAVLDLPFEAPKHTTKIDGNQFTMQPGGPLVVFHEEVSSSNAPEANQKILVSQNFYRYGDRHRMENGEQVDKFINDEFLIHVVYGCHVVVTNPTSARQKINILLQIPQGAIPVLNSQQTRTMHLTLEPYHTQTLDYYFYFPSTGKYSHYPVHVARNEQTIAAAPAMALNVVDKPSKIDTGSWDYISQHGTPEQVLEFLDRENIAGINLERIAWRMRDAKYFDQVLTRLTQRHAYHHVLWSYALMHNKLPAATEFLKHEEAIINLCGARLRSTLLTIDMIERRRYQHLEYKPLVNARTHALGARRQIVNDRFYGQYHAFLEELCHAPTLTADDQLAVTYYLLLQDRIEEALASFGKVNREQLAMQMQYDYCAAYLALYREDFAAARAIAIKYSSHPVDRWRNTFTAIAAQLDEAEGKANALIDKEDQTQQQTQLAATQPSFDFNVEAKQIALNYQNLEQVTINYYEMDVELLFSRNPFVQQFQGEFSSIKANSTETVKLSKDQTKKAIPLPAALQGKNVVVEITAAGQTKTVPYYSHSLSLQTIENYGQIKVTHQTTGKPVSKAYVKVYARTNSGQVKFYKDGYTDIRGRFDYASLSTNDLDGATRFSILVMSDEFGALVREAAPPQQ